ncbi:MAG: SMC-Scp complex subunit ScpB [Candidatus Omnitrophica bacterium]|nr:SMC-Scp complex subunit ScpB [Candidatus Omnitrophota bacterium]
MDEKFEQLPEREAPQEATGEQSLNYVRGAIESLLFVSERPVLLDEIKKVLNTVTVPEVKKIIADLTAEYSGRKAGMSIVEIAGGYQMLTNPQYVSYIRDFYKTKHKEKLSKPALESLAIVAYKQPVTRADIELIRGVNSDGVMTHLLDKELIKMVGRKDVPGKPYLYGTTKQFLEYFGLRSLEDLPKLEEFVDMLTKTEEEKAGILPVEDGAADLPNEEFAAPDSAAREPAIQEPNTEESHDTQRPASEN